MRTEIFYRIEHKNRLKFLSLKSEFDFSVAEGLARLKEKYKGAKIRPASKNELITLNLKSRSIVLNDIHENQFFKDFKKALTALKKTNSKPMLALAQKYGL